ncbi:response regulator, partial [Pseudomonas sp. FEN]
AQTQLTRVAGRGSPLSTGRHTEPAQQLWLPRPDADAQCPGSLERAGFDPHTVRPDALRPMPAGRAGAGPDRNRLPRRHDQSGDPAQQSQQRRTRCPQRPRAGTAATVARLPEQTVEWSRPQGCAGPGPPCAGDSRPRLVRAIRRTSLHQFFV